MLLGAMFAFVELLGDYASDFDEFGGFCLTFSMVRSCYLECVQIHEIKA